MKIIKTFKKIVRKKTINDLIKEHFFEYDDYVYNRKDYNIYFPQTDWEWVAKMRAKGARVETGFLKDLLNSRLSFPLSKDIIDEELIGYNYSLQKIFPDFKWIGDIYRHNEEFFRLDVPETDDYYIWVENYYINLGMPKEMILAEYDVEHLRDINFRYNIVYRIETKDGFYHIKELFCREPLH